MSSPQQPSNVRDKRECLRDHLPFIEEMLAKVKNTPFEQKWQKILDIISADDKV